MTANYNASSTTVSGSFCLNEGTNYWKISLSRKKNLRQQPATSPTSCPDYFGRSSRAQGRRTLLMCVPVSASSLKIISSSGFVPANIGTHTHLMLCNTTFRLPHHPRLLLLLLQLKKRRRQRPSWQLGSTMSLLRRPHRRGIWRLWARERNCTRKRWSRIVKEIG